MNQKRLVAVFILISIVFSWNVHIAIAGKKDNFTGAVYLDDFKNPDKSKIQYFGNADEGSVASNSIDKSLGDHKTLILLIEFLNSAPHTKTAQEIQDITFNGQFQKFYTEQSYGKLKFSGNTLGWFMLPREDNCENLVQPPYTGNEIEQLIVSQNIDIAQYDHMVMALNLPCFYGGQGTIGKIDVEVNGVPHQISVAWVNAQDYVFNYDWQDAFPFPWTYWDYTLSHEVGHNLGLVHASGLDCGDQSLADTCNHIEYGNYFDVMGMGQFASHFNGFYKELLGWVKTDDTIVISKSGNYTLDILNSSDKKLGAKRVAKIIVRNEPSISANAFTSFMPGDVKSTYYLEYRKGFGFDGYLNDPEFASNQQGLFINKISTPEETFPFAELIDASATGEDWVSDLHQATLNANHVFIDAERGIKIGPITKVTDTSISFDVVIEHPAL